MCILQSNTTMRRIKMEINYFFKTVLEERESYFDDKNELLSLEEVSENIANRFENAANPEIMEVIEAKANELINNYMIDMKRKYDSTYNIEQLGYELLSQKHEKLKEMILENWDELEEFKIILDEIVYLGDKHNVLKLLESIQ